MRTFLVLSACPLLLTACLPGPVDAGPSRTVPDEDFSSDHSVRILSPAANAWVDERVDVEIGSGHPSLLRGITHSISVSTRCMILVRACAVKYFVCRF